MEIKKNKIGIDLGLLFMLLLGTVFLPPTFFFVVSCVFFFYVLLKNQFKMHIPSIPGVRLYVLLIVLGIMVGLSSYSFRAVTRDIYYFGSTIIWLFIGTNITFSKSYKLEQIYKTLFLFGILVSLYCFFVFFINGDWGFNGIRQVFVIGIYDIGFIFPIFVKECLFEGKIIFSKRIDRVCIVVLTIHIFLSLGRISMFVPLLLIVLFMLIELKIQNRPKNLRRVLTLTFLILFILAIVVAVVPKNIWSFFIEKIYDSATEINSSQVINSTGSAMDYWRGYEIQASIEQWKQSDIIQRLFGAGLGKGIHISFVPYSWVGMVENNEIPLLHNGYYTALIKIGLLGIISLIYIFIGTMVKAIKGMKKDRNHIGHYVDLLLLAIGGCIYTYVVRGPIQQGAFLTWGLLMGALNSKNVYK